MIEPGLIPRLAIENRGLDVFVLMGCALRLDREGLAVSKVDDDS